MLQGKVDITELLTENLKSTRKLILKATMTQSGLHFAPKGN
jgi:hypothetical protein